MSHPLAGQPAPKSSLISLPDLIARYYEGRPDHGSASQRISFGTVGHRGSAQRNSFNETHILAIAQAICDLRIARGIDGPIFVGKDPHALSTAAQMSVLRVLAANSIPVRIAENHAYTPAALLSFAILEHDRANDSHADGILIASPGTPSEGGIRYLGTDGAEASREDATTIETRANVLMRSNLEEVKTLGLDSALANRKVRTHDFITPYVEALPQIIDLEAIRDAGLRIGVDPLGGATLGVYEKINEMHDLGLLFISHEIDPQFGFMTLDHDGKIRMDCTSSYAMAPLMELHEKYDLAFANDPEGIRHGIVTPASRLMPPSHFTGVAVWYLFNHRELPKKCWWNPFGRCRTWRKSELQIGKTLLVSAMVDRVAREFGKSVIETPTRFGAFAEGLHRGTLGFGSDERSGATCLRMDGTVWTTERDGIVMNLLAAEIRAKTGRDPVQIYGELEQSHGHAYEAHIGLRVPDDQSTRLGDLRPEDVPKSTLGGEKIDAIFTDTEPGGIKIVTENGWAAITPYGSERCFIFAESFLSRAHLERILEETQALMSESGIQITEY